MPQQQIDRKIMTKLQSTPLYKQHLKSNAKIVDFGGWALPVNYGSQIDEHNAVRNHCGMFDVSHMTVSDLTGPDTIALLEILLANDIQKITSQPGKALYSCMLNEQGKVIDDLIVYHINHQHCRLVTNASTRQKDMAWIEQQATGFNTTLTEQPELALIAVQGPDAITQSLKAVGPEFAQTASELPRFSGTFYGDEFVGRTGYTGEDGFEFIVSIAMAQQLWETLINQGVQPCGLGARDTLRLEAGMALYGNDLDESHTPLESGLSWTVSKRGSHNFIGKKALSQNPSYKMIGLVLQDRGVLRSHQPVLSDNQVIGEITSGTFSPTLQKSIALARINTTSPIKAEQTVQIEIRNKQLNAIVVPYPFINSSAK